MSNHLQAIPDTATGSVTLDIIKTGDIVRITRSNVNGSSEVRVGVGQLPSPAEGGVVRTNLIPNPSFETSITGYTEGHTDLTLSRVGTGSIFGDGYLQILHTAPTNPNQVKPTHFTVSLTGGKTYTFSAYFRTNVLTGVGAWMFANVVGSSDFSTTRLPDSMHESGWARFAHRFTVPGSGTQSVRIGIGIYDSNDGLPDGAIGDFDGLLLEESNLLGEFFDGSFPDANGISYEWNGLAHASSSILTSLGGRLIITDYEAAQGLNTYNVYASNNTVETISTTLELDKPWLMVPVAPNYSETVETITNYSAGRETNSTIHRILGRSDPLVVLGKLGSRSGMLEFFAHSVEDANRLARVFDRGEAVFLKQTVPGLDMYITATGMNIDPYAVEGPDETVYRFTVNYQEVSRPVGDLAGALGWTYDTMASTYNSFDEVLAAFATFDDLTIMDEK